MKRLVGWFGVLSCIFLFCASRVLSAPQNPQNYITLAAVGDVMLARGVANQIERQGVDYPFARTASTLRAADITFGNLECALTTQSPQAKKPVNLIEHPSAAIALAIAGFDVLSLANNHALDGGAAGLEETLSTLRCHKIGFCGAGSTQSEAESPFIIEKNGVRVAFVAFTQFGGENLAPASEPVVRRVVENARHTTDVVVASFHWGIENEARPSALQKRLARVAAQSGADLILGHHPHVLQGWKVLPGHNKRSALVVYSLGNFVFDQRGLGRVETIILQCKFGKNGLMEAEAIPVEIHSGQPRVAEAKKDAIQQRLKELSAEMGTALMNGKLHLSF